MAGGKKTIGQPLKVVGTLETTDDIVAISKDIRTRTGSTGGGDVFSRSFFAGPAGYYYITDPSGNRIGFLGPDGSPASFLLLSGGAPGSEVPGFQLDLATGLLTALNGVAISNPLSSSVDALSFNDGTVNVGLRAYSSKGSTQYDLYIDGVLVCSTNATRMSFAAGKYIVVSNVGQASEYNIGTVTTTAAVDWAANGASQRLTLTNGTACTVSMTPPATVGWLTLKTISPASGTVPAITYPVAVKWAGGTKPVQAATLGRANIQRLYWDGTNYWGDAIVNAA